MIRYGIVCKSNVDVTESCKNEGLSLDNLSVIFPENRL